MTFEEAKTKLREDLIQYFQSIDMPLKIEDRKKIKDKDVIRKLASWQRKERLQKKNHLIECSDLFLSHFASGHEVDPQKIEPELCLFDSQNSDAVSIFDFAALTWSVSTGQGWGRRLKYLIRDRQNKKIMGLLALGEPVVHLGDIDRYIGWNLEQRKQRTVNIMNAYVLGALPPYNMLLGGKLVACLVRSHEIYKDFQEYYSHDGFEGLTTRRNLLMLNTFSSMGRSSVYNRLKLNGIQYFKPVGYTTGYGDFHLSTEIRNTIRKFCEQVIKKGWTDDEKIIKKFKGDSLEVSIGRLAKYEEISRMTGIEDIRMHGIRRQIFLTETAANSCEILRTGEGEPQTDDLKTVEQISEEAKERWVVPRSGRRSEWKDWDKKQLKQLIC